MNGEAPEEAQAETHMSVQTMSFQLDKHVKATESSAAGSTGQQAEEAGGASQPADEAPPPDEPEDTDPRDAAQPGNDADEDASENQDDESSDVSFDKFLWLKEPCF